MQTAMNTLSRGFTTKEAAEHLRVSYQTVARAIGVGQIKAVKLGARWRIPVEEMERISREGFSTTPPKDNRA